MKRARGRQGGATLLIVLIMLIMLTLFAVSAMNTGNVNLKVVGNMQARSEALAASQAAIVTVISTLQFVTSPANAVPSPCGGTANTLCLDVNGDGTPDYTTTLTPTPACVQARATKISELNLSPSSEDLACTQAQQQGSFGVAGAASTGDSLCGSTVWEITAQTLASGSTVASSTVNLTTTQGIGVRVKALDMVANCP
jgi:Tfp pilus assembly protein PilX